MTTEDFVGRRIGPTTNMADPEVDLNRVANRPYAMFDEGRSLVPTESDFSASRRYATLEGGAGYWGLGWRTPARMSYDASAGYDDTPDPNFTPERRKILISMISPQDQARWGEAFMTDLEKTSVSEANMMYRVTYKKDVDSALDTLNYYDENQSLPGWMFSNTLNAVGNYMAVDPITTGTMILTLGASGIAAGGAAAARAAATGGTVSKYAELASWGFNMNQKFGSAIRWGSVGANMIDGTVSGYGMWAGHNKDQKMVYGDLAELDASPVGEMAFGALIGAAAGTLGAVMHAKQFKVGAINPYAADPIAEAFAATGLSMPNAVGLGNSLRSSVHMDGFIDAVRSIPGLAPVYGEVASPVNAIVASRKSMIELGWESAEDIAELTDFVTRARPTALEFEAKLMERVNAQIVNVERRAKYEKELAVWKLNNPGADTGDAHGATILDVVEARLKGRKDVTDARAVGRSLLSWIDNRQWAGGINGREEMSAWVTTVADTEDILRLVEFRNWEARTLAGETTALSEASARYSALVERQTSLAAQVEGALGTAKAVNARQEAFNTAQQAISEGRWTYAVNILTDVQDDIMNEAQEAVTQLGHVVGQVNQSERMIASRIARKTAPGVGERIDALRVRLAEIQNKFSAHQSRVNNLKYRIAKSQDGATIHADMQELSALQSWKKDVDDVEVKAIRDELSKFDKIDEELKALYYEIEPEELAKLAAIGRQAVDRMLKWTDGIPYSEFEILDDAVLRLWRSHADVAITSNSVAMQEGRTFLGVRAFHDHLRDGTMPLRPAMPAPKRGATTSLPGMPKLKPGEKLMTGADMVDAGDRILLDEMAKADAAMGKVPTNVTFDEAITKVEATIANKKTRIGNINALAKTGDAATIARRADAIKPLQAELDAALKLRNKLQVQSNKVSKATIMDVRPTSPTVVTPKSLRQAAVDAAKSKMIVLREQIEAALTSNKATIEDIAALQKKYREQVAIAVGNTAHKRNRMKLRMIENRLAVARRNADMLRSTEPAASSGVVVNASRVRVLNRLNAEVDLLTKEATALTKKIADSTSVLNSGIRVGGREGALSVKTHGMAALWRARAAAFDRAGSPMEAERISRDVLHAMVGDERTAVRYPTFEARFVSETGEAIDDVNLIRPLINDTEMLPDGTLRTADGVIHSPSAVPPPPIRTAPAKTIAARADAGDPAALAIETGVTAKKLDEHLFPNIIGDTPSIHVANGNRVLLAMRENWLFRPITDIFRRLLTAGTGASEGIFSSVGSRSKEYEIFLSIANMVDNPLLIVRDFGGRTDTFLRSMHGIKADIMSRTATLVHRSETLAQGLTGDWNMRLRSALIRNDATGLGVIETELFRLHREFYDHFSDLMRRNGHDVPVGYCPSVHNVAWIDAHRTVAAERLSRAFARNYMNPTEALENRIVTHGGIDRSRYAATATVGDLTPADAAIYRTATDAISNEDAVSSINRMAGGLEASLPNDDTGLRRVNFRSMHTSSASVRRFEAELLTDPTLSDMWVHDLKGMANGYAESGGLRIAIDTQLSEAVGTPTTMSELLHHAAARVLPQIAALNDKALMETTRNTFINLEEKIFHAYHMSGVLKARNSARGDVLARGVTGITRAGVGHFWGLQTTIVEIPKAIWFNAGKHGLMRSISDARATIANSRHLINDFGASLEGLGSNHRAAMAGVDGTNGALNMTIAGRFVTPWKRAFGIASGNIADTAGTGNRLIDGAVAGIEALADTNVRMGGLHYASYIARDIALKGANRQIYNLSKRMSALAAEMRALPIATRQTRENVTNLAAIAGRYDIDTFDLARMNKAGMFREDVAANIQAVIGALNDPDELFEISRVRGLLSDASVGSAIDYMDEAAHLAVPTQRTSSAMTSRNINAASQIFFMLTSYTRAFGTQNMLRMGAQTGGLSAIGGFGVLYAGEMFYQHAREIINGRETPEGVLQEWQDNPSKQMFKSAARIPWAGMYTSLGMWGVDFSGENREVKSFGGVRPAIEFVGKVKDTVQGAVTGKFNSNSAKLLDYAPIYGAWQAKAAMKAYGFAFDD